MLELSIENYINQLVTAYPEIKSIWLFGSRANNTAHENSDWDFLVFGSSDIIKSLQKDTRFHSDPIDLLVVDNDGNFVKPWGENPKHGSLTEWDWKEVGLRKATYRATKPIYNEDGTEQFNVKVLQCEAIRLYPE